MLVTDLIRLVTLGTAMFRAQSAAQPGGCVNHPRLGMDHQCIPCTHSRSRAQFRLAVSLMNTQLQESLVGLGVIKVYNRAAAFVGRFRAALKQALNAANTTSRYSAQYTPIMDALMAVVISLLLWVGVRPFLFKLADQPGHVDCIHPALSSLL